MTPSTQTAPGSVKQPLFPFAGFKNSCPREEVPITQLTGPSHDWLFVRGRLRRRPGRATIAAQALEYAWGAKARRMSAVSLKSITNGLPTAMVLYANESLKAATLAFKSTNTGAWRQVGQEFSAHHYPDASVPNHRVMPLVYENEHSGLTLHRLNTAEYRAHLCAGSRDVLQVGDNVYFPAYHGTPANWDGGFNESVAAGANPYVVVPTGMVPPMMMPTVSRGKSLGTNVGPWKGANCYYHSVIYENERGEWSMFTVPRPPGSAWVGYEGFGYVEVDSANLTTYYDAMLYSFIADGPPGTKWKYLIRSVKADAATTLGDAGFVPSIANMGIFARIPQGQTSYRDTEGSDVALDFDPRILEMWKTGGLQFPPKARSMGRFDGHVTIGRIKPAPLALLIAPWNNGATCLSIDNPSLYTGRRYFAAVDPINLCLRTVDAGAVLNEITYDIRGLTLRELADAINSSAPISVTTVHNCSTQPDSAVYSYHPSSYIFCLNAFSGIDVGDEVVSTRYPPGTKVLSFSSSSFSGTPLNYIIKVSASAYMDSPILTGTAAAPTGGEDFVFIKRASTPDQQWCAQVVPGADAQEKADNLLRTHVTSISRFFSGSPIIHCDKDSWAQHLTAGMLVYSSANGGTLPFPAGTRIIDVNGSLITVDSPASRDWQADTETITYAYDTGDTATGLDPGYVRTFGNAFPYAIPWRKAYLDQFRPEDQVALFTAASPGYAQDGANTWMHRNRRGGPAEFGPLIGLSDVGASEVQLYARGRMLLRNPRTGLTHADADYTKMSVSWNRGAISPYAICAGNGWSLFLSKGGFFVSSGGQENHCISGDIYDPAAQVGERGELEYAIKACIAAASSGSDDFKCAAQLHDSIVHVRYFAGPASTDFDREIVYDFSAGIGRDGPSELFNGTDASGNPKPWPWSTPQFINPACSAWVAEADGEHHYAAIDAGAALGRIDEMNIGTEDNGALVPPMGYTGTKIDGNLAKLQPLRIGVIVRKAGEGTFIGFAQDSQQPIESMQFDDVPVGTSQGKEYRRQVIPFEANARRANSAATMRIGDDGTGPCTEISRIILYADPYDPLYKEEGP